MTKKTYAQVIRRLLPGDHIHHVAPTSKAAPTSARVAAIDAANAKRARRMAKRRGAA